MGIVNRTPATAFCCSPAEASSDLSGGSACARDVDSERSGLRRPVRVSLRSAPGPNLCGMRQNGQSARMSGAVGIVDCVHCGAANEVRSCPDCGRRWVVGHRDDDQSGDGQLGPCFAWPLLLCASSPEGGGPQPGRSRRKERTDATAREHPRPWATHRLRQVRTSGPSVDSR